MFLKLKYTVLIWALNCFYFGYTICKTVWVMHDVDVSVYLQFSISLEINAIFCLSFDLIPMSM